ncbi:MAG: GDP-mannose 4,6-dehydratase [Candidatus Hydrothermarchaeales archaeon]
MTSKVLVTGGAGFIGSNLVEALVEKYEVIVVDDLSTGKTKNLEKVKEKIEFHNKSILDKDIKKILKDVEAIFHLGAQINVRRSVENPIHDLDVNVKGTINLIENAPDLERVVFTSSGGAVYGEPEYLPVDEKHKTNPVSPYGISKLTGEKYLNYYNHNHGLKNTILRLGNVYGPRQDPLGEAGVIAIFLDKIKNNQKPIIFGDGEQTRDYVHVNDVVSSCLNGVKKEGVYNIGTGVETSVNQLVDILSKVVGYNVEAVHGEELKGEVRRIFLGIKKAKDELGWKPETTLEEGIKDLWKASHQD